MKPKVAELQYLHDTPLYQAIVSTGLGLRLAQGLSLNVTGFYSRVHDQLNLPRGEATDGEIFLRQRQLRTNHRFGTSFGVTFTFGSIYPNIVNPRMQGSFGVGMTMF